MYLQVHTGERTNTIDQIFSSPLLELISDLLFPMRSPNLRDQAGLHHIICSMVQWILSRTRSLAPEIIQSQKEPSFSSSNNFKEILKMRMECNQRNSACNPWQLQIALLRYSYKTLLAGIAKCKKNMRCLHLSGKECSLVILMPV